MPAVRLTDATRATYFDVPGGEHLDSRREAVKEFNVLPAKVQQAWLVTWSEEAASDELTGVEGIATMTAYLKENNRRSEATTVARRAVIVETLAVPLKEEHTVAGSNASWT